MLTAGTGIGKSTAAREIAYKLKVKDDLKIGLVFLEENPKRHSVNCCLSMLKSPYLSCGVV